MAVGDRSRVVACLFGYGVRLTDSQNILNVRERIPSSSCHDQEGAGSGQAQPYLPVEPGTGLPALSANVGRAPACR